MDLSPFLTTVGPFLLGLITLMVHNRVRGSEVRKNNATAEAGLADSLHKWLAAMTERAEKAEAAEDKARSELWTERGRVSSWRGYGKAARRTLLANNLSGPDPAHFGLKVEDF